MKKPTLVVSLDFELFWAFQDSRTLEAYGPNILGGRKAIPQMLELFEKHGIHATWATVGFLFGENEEELRRYFPQELPTYDNPIRSCYRKFGTIGIDEESDPYFYGASLVRKIASVSGQEIGSHTFSHYYCQEPGQTTDQFRADMQAALSIAQDKGFDLKSVILPRNQCSREYIDVLAELGMTSYRNLESNWVNWINARIHYRPIERINRLLDVYLPVTGMNCYEPKVENGIVNLKSSRMFKPYFPKLRFLEGLKLLRIKQQMRYAARHGLTFHLWWHPHNIGVNTEINLKQLDEIFGYYNKLKEKYGMRSLNMGEAADEILKK